MLAGICGETIDFEVAGLGTIQLRPMTFTEVSKARGLLGDELALNRAVLKYGIAEPALSDAQIDRLMDSASAGIIGGVVRRIMQLSGMVEDDELKNEAGAGS